jgi:hypothetical protein
VLIQTFVQLRDQQVNSHRLLFAREPERCGVRPHDTGRSPRICGSWYGCMLSKRYHFLSPSNYHWLDYRVSATEGEQEWKARLSAWLRTYEAALPERIKFCQSTAQCCLLTGALSNSAIVILCGNWWGGGGGRFLKKFERTQYPPVRNLLFSRQCCRGGKFPVTGSSVLGWVVLSRIFSS